MGIYFSGYRTLVEEEVEARDMKEGGGSKNRKRRVKYQLSIILGTDPSSENDHPLLSMI